MTKGAHTVSKKALGLFGLMLLVVAVGLVLTNAASQDLFKDLRPRSNEQYFISMHVPDGWQENVSSSFLEYFPEDKALHDGHDTHKHTSPDAKARILVTRVPSLFLGGNKLDDETAMSVIDDIAANGEQNIYGLTDYSATTISGRYGLLGETQETNSHYSSEMRALTFITIGAEDRIYRVSVMTLPDSFEQNREMAMRIIESLDFSTVGDQ